MNTDIRISTNLVKHHKIKRLIRQTGYEGFYSLICLWTYVSLTNVNGRLTNMDALDICLAAEWNGEDCEGFVKVLADLRLIEKDGDEYVIHDWHQHNPWASEADARGDKARFSRMAKTHNRLYLMLKEKGYTSISAEEFASVVEDDKRIDNDVQRTLTNRITPSPSPSPKEDIPDLDGSGLPFREIIAYLNEKSGSAYKATTKATQGFIKARWREGFRLDDFKAVIDNKVDEWKDNVTFSKFLRPETLFGNKFESYLQGKGKEQQASCQQCDYMARGKCDGKRDNCTAFIKAIK